MSVLKDLAQYLFSQATIADAAKNKVDIVPLPGPDGKFLVVQSEGNGKFLTVEGQTAPDSREHSIEAAAEIGPVLRWARKAGFMNVVTWYNRQGAIIVLDDENRRRHTVKLGLTVTDVWDKLRELDDGERPMDHRELMKLLRRDLQQWMGQGVGQRVIETLKSIEAVNGGTVASTQTAAKQGFGKQVESEIRSKSGEIPDEITLMVPIYRDPDFLGDRYEIRLSLECDGAKNTFTLKPFGDALDIAWDRATKVFGHFVANSAVPETESTEPLSEVFFGKP